MSVRPAGQPHPGPHPYKMPKLKTAKERKRNQRKRGIERNRLVKLACEEKAKALEREKRVMKSYERCGISY